MQDGAVVAAAALTFTLPRMRRPGELNGIISLLPENAIVAELGSFAGESAACFLQSPKVSHLLCVDSWTPGYDDAHDIASRQDMSLVRRAFHLTTMPYHGTGRFTVAEMTTLAAADLVRNFSLDMVYIDASHRYEDVKADMLAWLPKVKRGGWIAGHDCVERYMGVVDAIKEVLVAPDLLFPDTSWAKRQV